MDHSEIRKVASLARLSLTNDEVEAYGRQLTRVLEYVDKLNAVDVDGVEPMPHAVDGRNVFRPDDRAVSLEYERALQNAPRTDGQFFLVPRILEKKDA